MKNVCVFLGFGVFKNEFKFETAHGSLRIFHKVPLWLHAEWCNIQDKTTKFNPSVDNSASSRVCVLNIYSRH